jgi:hypothetical protein
MVAIAIRAAMLSDADIQVVSREQAPGLRQGIGAVCRFRYTKS